MARHDRRLSGVRHPRRGAAAARRPAVDRAASLALASLRGRRRRRTVHASAVAWSTAAGGTTKSHASVHRCTEPRTRGVAVVPTNEPASPLSPVDVGSTDTLAGPTHDIAPTAPRALARPRERHRSTCGGALMGSDPGRVQIVRRGEGIGEAMTRTAASQCLADLNQLTARGYRGAARPVVTERSGARGPPLAIRGLLRIALDEG